MKTNHIALAVAGPLWAAVSLAQVATRDGFDLLRHPLSLLSTGSLGWLQIVNFVVAGLLLVVGAGSLGGTWAPRLTRIAGVGMIGAGVLVMDPGNGFPVDHPEVPTTMSWHGLGHMAAGSVTFTALIAVCWVLARRAATRIWTAAGVVAGTALLVGWGWAMAGGTAGTLTLAVGAIAAMLHLSLAAGRAR
ncbi:DUF998 domain-containing protein [Actinoplanes couchii]|uniref:DUF998 domain-containing protein n=1 Tax=Actinoplanes couchii TaxID=403638 RepID=A0ABQ3XRC7_9ACTN|nr:DUF998 domain-containing protein [Actinoplanes couchii]MDR6320021.1 hypothetical protein [Actinoplanes couchii]GID61060.1 hypothetical protein Aco03nite_094640 [Actinoplanes couchii]